MPRFAIDNPAKMFVDNTTYRGDCRRSKPRYKVLVPATLVERDKEPEMVKVVNIGHGGCKFVGHNLVNTQGSVSMQFYLHCSENEWRAATPIHGRVIHVHQKNDLYIVNVDFKGSIFHEHGIEQLIEEHARS